jgi:hypothetical protein
MALQWNQEPRFAARGTTGNYYKIFPFSNAPDKYAATVTFLDENGNPMTKPIGGEHDGIDAAKAACESDYAKAWASQSKP